MRFLLLRPEGRWQGSVAFFREKGIDCVGLGLQKVTEVTQGQQALKAALSAIGGRDYVVVLSRHAAQLALSQLQQQTAPFTLLAIGAGTAQELTGLTQRVLLPEHANSEGILAWFQQQTSPANIALLKGVGGRQLLPQKLPESGFNLISVELYQREPISVNLATLPWKMPQIRCIIATSNELLEAMFRQFPAPWLLSLTWIVVSERIAQQARNRGVGRVVVSEGASDQQLLAPIQTLIEANNDQ